VKKLPVDLAGVALVVIGARLKVKISHVHCSTAGRTRIPLHFDTPRGTDVRAGAAADADLRIDAKGRIDLSLDTTAGKTDGVYPDYLLTGPHT
jgi:hypothetical protein